MLVGHLSSPGTYTSLLNHNAWKEAFAWLEKVNSQLPTDGEYELAGHDLRAIVQTVRTKPREECVFEAHCREIDLQVCFEHGELIDWAPLHELTPRTEYDEKKDYTLYHPAYWITTIAMRPGTFAIFFPEDGHMPGIKRSHDTARKVVIKIAKSLFEGQPIVLGPFEVPFNYDFEWPPEAIFNNLVTKGQFSRINREDINFHNFPFSFSGHWFERDLPRIFLVNLGRSVHNNDVSGELFNYGFTSVASERVLALNAAHPELMDNHIIITTKTSWTGREGVPEVICLHNDAGNRRLRTHYSDTIWGPHIWYAVEKL